MGDHWYCFLIDGHKTRGISDLEVVIKKEVANIFGDDLVDVCIIGERVTAENFEVRSESYFFVKCKNYTDHVSRVKKSSIISFVLPSIDNPTEVPDNEVDSFIKTVSDKHSDASELNFGDTVLVKEGYLEGLYGIVLRRKKSEQYEVYFSFYTREFSDVLMRSNLVWSGTIFKHIREPVKMGDVFDITAMSEKVQTYIGERFKKPVVAVKGKVDKGMLSEKVQCVMEEKLDERKVHRNIHRKRKVRKRTKTC